MQPGHSRQRRTALENLGVVEADDSPRVHKDPRCQRRANFQEDVRRRPPSGTQSARTTKTILCSASQTCDRRDHTKVFAPRKWDSSPAPRQGSWTRLSFRRPGHETPDSLNANGLVRRQCRLSGPTRKMLPWSSRDDGPLDSPTEDACRNPSADCENSILVTRPK